MTHVHIHTPDSDTRAPRRILTTNEKRDKLVELLDRFDTGFLVSHGIAPDDGHYHARPMGLAGREESGDLWFFTAIDSPKVEEIARDPKVLVTFQDDRRFVAVVGHAVVSRDGAKIDKLWTAPMKVWFPDGKEDPRLVLLRVEVHQAEYWDTSGTKGLRYLFEAAKALIQGRTPSEDAADHDTIDATDASDIHHGVGYDGMHGEPKLDATK